MADYEPIEQVFGNSGIGGRGYQGLTDDEMQTYEAKVRRMMDDAIDYEQSYLALDRQELQEYYYGNLPSLQGQDDETTITDNRSNKSTFVSTDVRDTILTIIPSLIRIFTSTEQVAAFAARSEAAEELAKQQYEYANYVFYKDNDGFLMLHSLFKDALTVRGGFTTWWTDNEHEVEEQVFSNITMEQYQYLLSEMPDVEPVEMEQDPQTGMISHLRVRNVVPKPITHVITFPPEEFRINKSAKSIRTARVVGRERVEPPSFLVSKGLDPEDFENDMGSVDFLSDERFIRNPALVDNDRVDDGVLYGEWYIRIDGDGDGIDELRHICTVGPDRRIVMDEVAQHINFAIWSCDPTPHTAIGQCIADITIDIQRIKSYMLRGQNDNLADVINPRMVINELVVNIEDVLNDDIGAAIRTRGDPNASVTYIKPPYVGDAIQVSVDYLDKVRASRTGITEASKGLDPRAMQSTTLSGIDAILSGAQERIELIARILAETGLKPTMEGIVRELVHNPNPARQIKLGNNYVTLDPSLFDPTLSLEINPTLGKGTDTVRMQALQEVKSTQMAIIGQYGINNPIVSPVEAVNTLDDLLALVNIKNPGRYFKRVTPKVMQQIASAPEEPSPEAVLAQASLEEVKARTATAISNKDTQEKKLELDRQRTTMEDDFKRDKLAIDSMIRVLDIQLDPKAQVDTAVPPKPSPAVERANQPG